MSPSLSKSLTFCLFGLALPLLGCGSTSAGVAGNAPVVTSEAIGAILVKLEAGLLGEVIPTGATFVIEVLNQDGLSVLTPHIVAALTTAQEELLYGLPPGRYTVLVKALGSEGEELGSQQIKVDVDGRVVSLASVTSLTETGQTREIGLLSVAGNGLAANGPSHTPAISSDGNFVAFATTASNLVDGGPDPGTRQILIRDRAKGVLNRISIRPSGNDFSSDCSEPDISADGRFVVFRTGTTQGTIFVRDRGGVGDPAQTIQHTTGSAAKISADGRFITFEILVDGVKQILVRRVTTGQQENISLDGAAQFANGASTKPCISGTGSLVVFHSTATNLVAGGTPGVYLRNRSNQTTERLPIPAGLDDTSISADGRFVLASAPGQIPFLLDRTSGVGVSLNAIGAGLVGRPSMSGSNGTLDNARFIAFFSSNPNLIVRDINQRTDAFVLDRQSGVISRINVSNDGTAVGGGVDETVPLTGPAISADGERVAFAAADRLLVPDNPNSQLDVYSASVPKPGLLYVANGDNILRFNNASSADGDVVPVAKIEGSNTRLQTGIQTMFLDVANNRLYVATKGDENGIRDPEILVFNQISARNGNTAPNRIIQGLPKPDDMIIDLKRNILYFDKMAVNNASALNGVVSAGARRSFAVEDQQRGPILLDTRLDELYLTGDALNSVGNFVAVIKASTASGTVPFKRRLFGSLSQLGTNPPSFMAFDTSPRGIGGQVANDSSLILVDGANRISTYLSNGSRSGFLGNTAPLSVIPSTSPPLIINPGTEKAFGIAPGADVLFDSTTHLLYVADFLKHRVEVYNSPTPGVLAPLRILQFSDQPGTRVSPTSIALDRTRGR